MGPIAWWHGCWLAPGHFLFNQGGDYARTGPFADYGNSWSLDGGYAPRRLLRRGGITIPVHDDGIIFTMMGGADQDLRHRFANQSEELPQGRFLRHEVSGCTLLAWWDRTQGDTRGACNSVFIVDGRHHVDDMLRMFPERFPKQAKRLSDAGVQLVCVNKGIR